MQIRVFEDKVALGRAAAALAAASIQKAIAANGTARIIAATGASQFEFLDALTSIPNLLWQKVELFHLDEYIGLPEGHAASFRKYLRERLISKTGITNYHFLEGAKPQETIRRVGSAIQASPIDVAFVGIGENCHLAFNDPPANFESQDAFLIVNLDEPCRQQQVGEGWFRDITEVPTQAISMSVQQILKAKEILVIVPDARKAKAVQACCEGPVSPMSPASILRTHPNTTVLLDLNSSAMLKKATLEASWSQPRPGLPE